MANIESIRPPRPPYTNDETLFRFYSQLCTKLNELSTLSRNGDGTPEGSVTADPGTLYHNKTIASGEYAIYIKRTGTSNTGWEGVGTVLP